LRLSALYVVSRSRDGRTVWGIPENGKKLTLRQHPESRAVSFVVELNDSDVQATILV
jgi:hypothetical protein